MTIIMIILWQKQRRCWVMSKYSHFEMCEKIFGQKYKWNEQKHDYEPYSRTDMWNKMIEQQDKISDLETKLEESERKLEEYKKCNCKECMTDYEKNLNQIIDKFLNENIKLKQQLEEKEKEIEYQESMKILAVENQNKKAIEQLEQIINLFEPYENEEKDTILCANNGISFLEFIDNQIKQLKEGK